jgi:hypothetical protein
MMTRTNNFPVCRYCFPLLMFFFPFLGPKKSDIEVKL